MPCLLLTSLLLEPHHDQVTNGWMGAVETMLATAVCGIAYALIGGQPMMINGGTGPVLAFNVVLFQVEMM